MGRIIAALLTLAALSGCSVWPVNQDPAGMGYRRSANEVLYAVQKYRQEMGRFPANLTALTPAYLDGIPDIPDLRYYPADGSLNYYYVPSWPQLRPVRCQSVGDSTNWRCSEHLTDTLM